MPVDISMMGLQGLDSFQNRQESMARQGQMESTTRTQDFELQQAERLRSLGEEAGRMLNAIPNGERVGGTGSEDLAERMGSMGDPLRMIGDVYLRGGAPEEGLKYINAASEIEKRESDIIKDDVLTQGRRFDNIKKGADVVSRHLGRSRSQEEWNFGIQQLRDQGIVEPEYIDQLAAMPWSEDLAAFIDEKALSAYQNAQLEEARMKEERLAADGQIKASQAAQRLKLTEARHAQQKAYENARIKAAGGKGGADAGTATEQQVKDVSAHLRNSVFTDADEDDPNLIGATRFIANEAKRLYNENKALGWNQAIERATAQAQAEGMFGERTVGSGYFDEIPEHQERTFRPTKPMPNGNNEQIKAQLVEGEFYQTSRGRAMWDGTNWVLAKKGAGKK